MDESRQDWESRESEENREAPEPVEQPEFTPDQIESLSALQLFDLTVLHFIKEGAPPSDLMVLRRRIEEMEEIQEEARDAIGKLGQAVEKLRAPALRLGTLLKLLEEGRALVCANGTDFVCNVDPELPAAGLETGMRVLLNDAYAVVDSFGVDRSGPVVRVIEILGDGRLRVGQETGLADSVVMRSTLMTKDDLKPGLDVRLDSNQRVAVEVIGTGKRLDRSLTQAESLSWSAIGGQEEAVEAIRDTIELPYLHAELFEKFKHPVPKGFLLYGPPGCGKTMLGKAAAYNLKKQIRMETGVNREEFFLSVKGPEVLNMWLGESERQVRDLFAQCREKAAEGHLAFLFIDEAESILGSRSASRMGSNILSTLVPMFCTEMDGLEPLQNVVVILASNRADLIDPAILRPGRIDRKIRVRRPNRKAAEDIYRIYLTEDLPLADSRDRLVKEVTEAHFSRNEANRFLEITYRSGKRDHLYRGDMASGAIVAAVVERAKEYAIKRSIASGTESPIESLDLIEALEKEYLENDVFPPNDITEDWLKLTDFNPDNVVRLGPIRPVDPENASRSI